MVRIETQNNYTLLCNSFSGYSTCRVIHVHLEVASNWLISLIPNFWPHSSSHNNKNSHKVQGRELILEPRKAAELTHCKKLVCLQIFFDETKKTTSSSIWIENPLHSFKWTLLLLLFELFEIICVENLFFTLNSLAWSRVSLDLALPFFDIMMMSLLGF